MKSILACLLLLTAVSTAGIELRPALSLDQEHYLTTTTGIINPNEIIKAAVKDLIVLYLPDGTKFSGVITKAEFKTEDKFECFGEFHSHDNAGFGFVLTKGGVFAGAIVMRNTDTVYCVGYSEAMQGYVLIPRKLVTINI
jgi:hypothetical protein